MNMKLIKIVSAMMSLLLASQSMAASLVDLTCTGRNAKFNVKMILGEQPGQSSFPIEAEIKITAKLSGGSKVSTTANLSGKFHTRDSTMAFTYQQISINGQPFVAGVSIEGFKVGALTLIEGTLSQQVENYISEDKMVCK